MPSKTQKPKSPTPVLATKHQDKRANIPTEELRDFVADDEKAPKKILYPRDPSLDPQLVWQGKDEQDRSPLEVPAVPIYIQEKIHPQVIIENLRETARAGEPQQPLELFGDFNGIKFEQFIEFYRHKDGVNWANRMILGDSLLVMNSLVEKEGLKGKAQMIFLDPPYGIKFGSNWQVSTRKRDVNDGKTTDVSRQPEQIRAFRDTWKLGIHSYLAYLRDRLVVAQQLLTDSGSVFVQIGDENLHLVRALLDEVFGSENFCATITFAKTVGATSELLPGTLDYVIWYAKDRDHVKYRQLFREKEQGGVGATAYTKIELPDGSRRPMTEEERNGFKPVPTDARILSVGDLTSARVREGRTGYFPIEFEGHSFLPPKREWSTHRQGVERLKIANRIARVGDTGLGYVRFLEDFPAVPLTNLWPDTMGQN